MGTSYGAYELNTECAS